MPKEKRIMVGEWIYIQGDTYGDDVSHGRALRWGTWALCSCHLAPQRGGDSRNCHIAIKETR